MDFERCIPALSKAFGKAMSKEDVESLINQVKDRAQRKTRTDSFLSQADAVMQAAKEIKDEKLMNAARIERDAYNRALAWKSATAEIDRMTAAFNQLGTDGLGKKWAGYYDALRTFFFNRVGPVTGSSDGVFERAHNISMAAVDEIAASRDRILARHGFGAVGITNLSPAYRFMNSASTDRRVSIALGHLSNGVKGEDIRVDGTPLSKVELELAQNEWRALNDVKNYANDRGAQIGHADHYMGRMVHDPDAILSAGMTKWVARVTDLLNPELVEALGPKGLEQAWRNLVEGRHLGVSAMDVEAFYKDYQPGTKVRPDIQNLVAKLSAEKTLLFKDPESAYQYRSEFGGGRSLFEITANQVRRTTHDAELIHALGPTPEAMARELIDYAKNKASAEGHTDQVKRMTDTWLMQGIESSLRGDRYLTVNADAANVDSIIRNILTGLRLGAGALRQLPVDLMNHASTMRWYGQNYFGSLAKGLIDFLNVLPNSTRDEVQYRLGAMGAMNGIDVARQGLAARELTSYSGGFAKIMMTLSGQTRETRVLFRRGVLDANTALAYYGAVRDIAYADLPAMLRTKLGKYNIDEPLYDFMRKNLVADVNGFKIVDPTKLQSMYEANDPALRAFLGEGLIDRQFRIQAQDIANTIRNYGIGAAREALSEPDEAINVWKSLGNAKRGSAAGLIANQFTQFKTYGATQLTTHLGRELYDLGRPSFTGNVGYIANAMVGGYITVALLALVSGKTVPSPSDIKTVVDSAVMGGLGGFFTDATLTNPEQSNVDRVMRTIAPPVAGTLKQLGELALDATYDQLSPRVTKSNFGKDLATLTYSNAPGLNLWWTRGVADMFLRYNLMERVDPGYFARQERDLSKYGQHHFVQPVLTPYF